MNNGGFKNNFKNNNFNNFNNGTSGGGFSNEESGLSATGGSESQDGPKRNKNISLRRVTIKQIKDLQVPSEKDAPFFCDGHEISQVMFVAALTIQPEDLEAASAALNFEDGTGSIGVRFWLQSPDNRDLVVKQRLGGIPAQQYYQVVGQLKSFGEKVTVNGVHITPVTDPNEITRHFLEVIKLHLSFTKPKKHNGQPPSVPNTSFNSNQTHFASNPHDQNQEGNQFKELVLSTVYEICQLSGVATSDQIKNSNLSNTYSYANLDKALSELLEEGFLYEQGNGYCATQSTLN